MSKKHKEFEIVIENEPILDEPILTTKFHIGDRVITTAKWIAPNCTSFRKTKGEHTTIVEIIEGAQFPYKLANGSYACDNDLTKVEQ